MWNMVTFLCTPLISLEGVGTIKGLYTREEVLSLCWVGQVCWFHSCLSSNEIPVEMKEICKKISTFVTLIFLLSFLWKVFLWSLLGNYICDMNSLQNKYIYYYVTLYILIYFLWLIGIHFMYHEDVFMYHVS